MLLDALRTTARTQTQPPAPQPWQGAAVSTLLNGLLRERAGWTSLPADAARALIREAAAVVSLRLMPSRTELLVGLARPAGSGRQRFVGPILRRTADGPAAAIGLDALLDALLADSTLTDGVPGAALDRFRRRVLASAATASAVLVERAAGFTDVLEGPADFIVAEQALLLGHAFHPAPKCREGMTEQDQRRYGPDHGQGFPLAWFAVAPGHLATGERTPGLAAAQVQALIDADPRRPHAAFPAVPAGWGLIPVHPWQAGQLRAMDAVKALIAADRLRDLGAWGSPFYATSSFRCIFAPHAAHMLKFSLSCKITNSVRVMLPRELDRGLQFARVLDGEAGADLRRLHPGFTVLNEPAHLSLLALDGSILSESSVILRDNPFGAGRQQAEMLAFLCQDDPHGGRSRLGRAMAGLARNAGRTEADIAGEWFRRFLDLALAPLLMLQGDHGVLISAHQQNLLLALEAGWPSRAYVRDCQGTGYRDDAEAAFGADGRTENIIPAALAPRLFGYYVIGNTVLGVLDTLVLDGLADEQDLHRVLRSYLAGQVGRRDDRVVRYLLNADRLWLKGNLLTYLRDTDENATTGAPAASYIAIDNPMATRSTAAGAARPVCTPAAGGAHGAVLRAVRPGDRRDPFAARDRSGARPGPVPWLDEPASGVLLLGPRPAPRRPGRLSRDAARRSARLRGDRAAERATLHLFRDLLGEGRPSRPALRRRRLRSRLACPGRGAEAPGQAPHAGLVPDHHALPVPR